MTTPRYIAEHLGRYEQDRTIDVIIPDQEGGGAESAAPSSSTSPLASELERLRSHYDLTLRVIAEELSRELGVEVKYPRVYAWMTRNIQPRSFSEIELLRAIESIEARHQYVEGGVWVGPEEVSRVVRGWMQPLTSGQIEEITGIPAPTIRSWSCGNHHVRRVQWDKVCKTMDEFIESLNAAES